MTDDFLNMLRLLQISDSSFPTGGFAFSNGLETLASESALATADDVERFLRDQLLTRWATFDRWFLGRALEADGKIPVLSELDWLCDAQNNVHSLSVASRRMGRAILSSHERIGMPQAGAYLAAMRDETALGHLPVAQGLVAAGLGLPRNIAEVSAVHQLIVGALSAAIRLGKLGALQAQVIHTALTPAIADLLDAPLPEVPHSFTPLADIAAMRHGDHATRLFAA